MKKIVYGIMLALLSISMLTFTFNVHPVKASGTIYIRANGSVDPSSAPIQRSGNVYTFTGNINEPIIVERSNIVIDGADYTLQGTGSSRGIDLAERVSVTVKNVKIKTFNYGIWLDGSSYNNITKNTITDNDYDGIHLEDSSHHNHIIENNLENNFDGICLQASSNNNDISGNTVKNSDDDGIEIYGSSYNTIVENRIENNSWSGIYLYDSSNNNIYHNSFVNNVRQVYTSNSVNTWDNGYPSGGNYWSDYNGTDANGDGIGDTPYIINANNQDRYPKIQMPYGGAFNWLLLIIIIVGAAVGAVTVIVLILRLRKRPVTKLPPPPPPPPPPL